MARTSTIDQARAAKHKALELFDQQEAVVGIGIARVGKGYGLKVNLQQPLAEQGALPQEIDGVPIRFEVVGPIRKR
jgi:hypothetical protein